MNRLPEEALERAESVRQRSELDELMRRFSELARCDQLEFCSLLRSYMAVDHSLLDDERLRQHETISCIRQAMEHLGIDVSPTVAQYDQTARELDLDWSSHRIIRLWGSWSHAAGVATGGRLPATAQQRAFISRFDARTGFEREEHFAAVRQWLATRPALETHNAYDEFAREYNYKLEEGELPLPRYATVIHSLCLSWRDVVAVAKGELDHAEAVKETVLKRDWSRGPHNLIGLGTVALLTGKSRSTATWPTQAGDFPRPALVLGGHRIWLYEELTAYLAGERHPLLGANRLHDQYLSNEEAASIAGVSPNTLLGRLAEKLPPVGRAAGRSYWLPSEVEAYAKANAAAIERRRARRRRPRSVSEPGSRSRFVTIAGLARELGVPHLAARRIAKRPGFPQPVARFGDAVVWLREDVSAHLAGREVPSRAGCALQEELIDTAALAEHLGYTVNAVSRMLSGSRELPPIAANVGGTNVWVKDDIYAWLAAEPHRDERRRARLERLAGVAERGGEGQP